MKQEEECHAHGEMKGLHFYCIISPYCFQHRRLLIPNSFITSVGCNLSSPALLKLPSGKEWQVEVEEHKGQYWFQNGCHEFMQHHSIRVIHFLVFRFDGNSRFTVFIFDNTASEICYPSDTDGRLTGPQTSVKQENQDEGSLDFHPNNPRTATRVISNLREICRVTEPRRFTSLSEREQAVIAARAFTSAHPFFTVTMKPTHVHQFFLVNLPIRFARAYLKEDIKSVTLRVSDERIWQVQYVNLIDRVRLTNGWKTFVLDNCLDEDDMCIFELVDKRHWEFKVTIFRVQDPKSSKRIPARSKNSSCSSGNNGMEIDDITKTREISDSEKQIKNEEFPLMVHKNDNVNFSNSGRSLSSQHFLKHRRCTSLFETQRATTAARLFTSTYPFCTVTMKPSHVQGLSGVNLPIAFARSYLKEDIHSVTLWVSQGKTWQVRYCSKKGQAMLKTGWKVFVVDNYLEEDNICIFELVDKTQWVLKVTIFRIQDPKLTKRVLTPCKNISCNPGHILGNKRSQNEVSGKKRKFSTSKEEMGTEEYPFIVDRDDKLGVTNTSEPITSKLFSGSRKFAPFSKEERKILEERMFSSIYPYCSVIMKPSHVHEHFKLNLPILFTRAYLKKDIQSVTLQVTDGRIWQVQCCADNHQFKLCKGWKQFVLGNYLEEDDVCFFELVDRKYGELNVTIFRVQDHELRKRISALSKIPSCLEGDVGMPNEDSGEKRKVSDLKEHIKLCPALGEPKEPLG